jgi:polyvinyl alcohol dehydrogenase (cytochrome)
MRIRPSRRIALALSIAIAALTLGSLGGVAHGSDTEPATATAAAPSLDERGATVFKAHCATCHDQGVGHAPPKAVLGMMPAGFIRDVLTSGAMKVQAQGLSDDERTLVAEYLAGRKAANEQGLAPPPCAGAAAEFKTSEPPELNGWGLSRGNGRTISRSIAGLTVRDLPRLKLKWVVGFPGAIQARSHPGLAGGAIYIGSQTGAVYALDRDTGCLRWTFHATAEVRTAIVISPWKVGDAAARPRLYFGDLVGNVYALDARNGALVWRDHADPHASATITGAPTLARGRLYVPVSSTEEAIVDPTYPCCTFRGSVIAYDASSGRRLWQTYTVPPAVARGRTSLGAPRLGPSGIAIWSAPTVDVKRGQLYVATGNNYSSPTTAMSDAVIALDLATGRVKWVYQARPKDAWNSGCRVDQARPLCPEEEGPDYDFGAAPILAATGQGRDLLLAGAKSGVVHAVDPDSGKLIWRRQIGRGGVLAGVYFSLAVSGDRLFVPITDAPDGKTYGMSARPGLHAVDLRTGRRLWDWLDPDTTCQGRPYCVAGIAGTIAATPDMVLTGGSDGQLRIFNAATGRQLWTFDTTPSFKTVGGADASGGAIGGGVGPIAYHGMLIVPSGYAFTRKMPGNLLLAFGLE